MATKPKAKAGAKGGRKTAAKNTSTKAKAKSGNTRASSDELDALAEQVVEMRETMSWGEIQEELGISGSRARALFNRGGGVPSNERRGAAAKEDEDEKPKGKAKAKAGAKGSKAKRRPS